MPMDQVVTLPYEHLVVAARFVVCGPDEQLDEMLPPLVHQRGHRPVADLVEAAADQLKATWRQVYDRR